jgi:hypothetical protein
MSIRDRQIQEAEDRIVRERLISGQVPDLTYVQQQLNQEFRDIPAGLPRFHFKPWQDGQPSDPDAYNEMMRKIHQDLQIAFDEITYQQNRMMAIADYYETEKNKITWEIEKVERRIQALYDQLDISKLGNAIAGHFHSFSHVDFIGDDQRNIPRTNVLVDLRTGQALLDKVKQGAARYDISNAVVTIKSLTQGTSSQMLSDPSNALKDTVNEAWQYLVKMSSSTPVDLQVTLDLNDAKLISTVRFESQSPAPTAITCFISNDNVTYRELQTITTKNIAEWAFDPSVIRYVRFVLHKDECDYTDGTDYCYLFGASRIMVKKEAYQATGVLVTQPYEVDQIIDKVQVIPDATIPPGTNIRYYIGMDDGINPVEWMEADSSGLVDFGTLILYTDYIDSLRPNFGQKDEVHFNQQYYSLADLTYTPVLGRTRLYLGDQMWKVDTLSKVPATQPTATGPQDWMQTAGMPMTTQFMDINNVAQLQPGTFQRFSLSFSISKPQMPIKQRMNVTPGVIVAVYLNNQLLKGIQEVNGTSCIYNFKQGVNSLVVYTFTPANLSTATMSLNLNLMSVNGLDWVRAIENPLTEVSLTQLYNNTSRKDMSRYAIKGNQIILNFDPVGADVAGRGIRAHMEYFHVPDGTPTTNFIRLMAMFTRSQSAGGHSAALSGYKLVIS